MLLFIIMAIATIAIGILFFKIAYADITLSDLPMDKFKPIQKNPSKKPHYIFLEIKKHYNPMYRRSDPNRLYGKIGVFTINFAYAEKQMHFSGTIEAFASMTPHYDCTIKYNRRGQRKPFDHRG
jgi:hypothetical protein